MRRLAFATRVYRWLLLRMRLELVGLAQTAEVDAELLAFFVEVAALEAQGFCGVGHVVVMLLQYGEERLAFEGFDARS